MSTQFMATGVRTVFLAGVLGLLAFPDGNPFIQTGINSAPQAYNVQTITVAGSPADSHDFTVTINGIACTYTADSSSTSQEVVDGLTAAINNEPGVRATVRAVATSSTVVTVTGITPGVTFTMTDADGDLTCAVVTAATAADAIEFGRLVVGAASLDSTLHLPSVFKPVTTNLAAQVDTITVDYAASEVYYIDITMDGETYHAEVDANTNDDTTATDIRAAINAAMPASTVVATGATDQVILTSEVLGRPFVTRVGVKSETVARLALVHTTATGLTDVTKSLRGITTRHDDQAATTVGGSTSSYAANAGVNYCTNGCVWVASTEAVTPDSDVYVETSGASAGLFYTTGSATRIKLPRSRFQWGQAQAADGIAQLRIFTL